MKLGFRVRVYPKKMKKSYIQLLSEEMEGRTEADSEVALGELWIEVAIDRKKRNNEREGGLELGKKMNVLCKIKY